MTRRTLLRTTAALAATGMATGLYAWQVEPFWLEFVGVKMPVRNLPEALVGKTLMQVSDLHVGNRFDYQFLIDSFREAQRMEPDIVVYTGDYVSYEDEAQFDQLTEVMAHALTGTLGTVGVLGNHDYGKNWAEADVADRIAGIMEAAGVRMLRNERAELAGLGIIGMDDWWGTNYDADRALSLQQRDSAEIVLCHNPDVCDLDVWRGYRGWILSGHTHGGQCKPPFLPPPVLPVANERYTAGSIDLYDGRTLYINRALGHLWQVRFNVRPEVTVFELDRCVEN